MICDNCFTESDCTLRPTSEDQCNVFLKKMKVEMSGNISINPMDTIQISYDDLKDLLKALDIDLE